MALDVLYTLEMLGIEFLKWDAELTAIANKLENNFNKKIAQDVRIPSSANPLCLMRRIRELVASIPGLDAQIRDIAASKRAVLAATPLALLHTHQALCVVEGLVDIPPDPGHVYEEFAALQARCQSSLPQDEKGALLTESEYLKQLGDIYNPPERPTISQEHVNSAQVGPIPKPSALKIMPKKVAAEPPKPSLAIEAKGPRQSVAPKAAPRARSKVKTPAKKQLFGVPDAVVLG